MPIYTAILVEGMEQSAMRAGSWQKTEVVRLRPTGYAATRRSAAFAKASARQGSQRSAAFASWLRRAKEDRKQRAVSLSVISY